MREYYSIVTDNLSPDSLTSILEDTKATEIVILSELEWEFPSLTVDIVNQYKDKKIKVVLGSFDTINEYAETIYWPTFWINWTYENLRYVKVPDIDLKYPFISLNNRSHLHRCIFIDEMAKHNLIDKGIVTWVKHLNENSDYPYKHFDNKQLLLEDDFKTKLDSFLIPKEYNQSLFHVVTEATHHAAFITEKTAIPLYLKKPFFVLASPGFYKHWTNLGFKLYDEIIDYSFDNIDNLYDRTERFVSNVPKLINLNLQEAYELLRPKLEFNYNRAIEITRNVNYIPKIIQERYYDNKEKNIKPMLVDYRYETFMNWCLND